MEVKGELLESTDCKTMEGKEEEEEEDNNIPVDKHKLVYLITYFTGLVILFPWNILITVSGYWDYKFRNVSWDGNEEDGVAPPQTSLQKEFTSYLSIAANVPNATFVILHALFGHKFGMKGRIVWSQIGQIIVFLGILILSIVNSDDWQHGFLIANLVTIVFLNVFSAIFQGSVTANLGTFPVEYIGACVNGAGMGGLIPSIFNVLILAANADAQMAGFWCFLFAEIIVIACLALTFYVFRNPFFRHYSELERPQTSAFNVKDDLNAYKEILKSAWVFLLVTLLNFTVTLVVFPAVTVLIVPKDYVPGESEWKDTYFVPVGCFVLYNLGDYIGKTLASLIQWPSVSKTSQAILLVAAVARIAFIPLFMFCNVSTDDRNTEVAFESEVYYFVFMVLLSVSNGYVGNLAMMFGPKVVKPQYQEMTAAFLIAALVVGCGIGSIISSPVVKLL